MADRLFHSKLEITEEKEVAPHHQPLVITPDAEVNVRIISISKRVNCAQMQKRGRKPVGYQEVLPLRLLK